MELCRIAGTRERREEVGRRRVALEETLEGGVLVWVWRVEGLVGGCSLTCLHSGRQGLRSVRMLSHTGFVGWCLGSGWRAIYAPRRGLLLCNLRDRVWSRMIWGVVEKY